MRIKVEFSNLVANIAGCAGDELTLPEGATFRELLGALVEKHGDDFRDLLFARQGQLRRLAHMVVDGKDVAALGGLDAAIVGSPQVSIVLSMPGVGGG